MTDTNVLDRIQRLYKNCKCEDCDKKCEKCLEAIGCVKDMLKLRREIKFIVNKCNCIEDV